mmetsp:Transcript_52648/g.102959  ORF Transcript_52648/g.102959 Transcript_52648/m.102959 type:complete len:302 (-) Transcript_52648:154-1059(-)
MFAVLFQLVFALCVSPCLGFAAYLKMKRVAVVTGANKGIGFQIARSLCKKLPEDFQVVLTSRDAGRGAEALAALHEEGLKNVEFCQLDVADEESVRRFRGWLEKNFGGLDILVNNAGFAFKFAATEPVGVQAKETCRINYFGTLSVLQASLPLLRNGARVVIVGSTGGLLRGMAPARQRQFLDPELTEEGLSSLISEFVEDAHQAAPASRGWLGTTYGNSKAGANQLAAVLARNMGRYTKAEDVLINACCPGWCKTDMAGWERPPKTAEQGAETPVFLATLPPGAGLSGRFFSECQDIGFI